MASCSNDETTNSREVIVPKSDVAVSLGAESNIAIEQTRAVVDKWAETPIYVWGLDKAEGADWTTTTSNLFSPASYVPGIVTNTTDNNGTVKLGNVVVGQVLQRGEQLLAIGFIARARRFGQLTDSFDTIKNVFS